MVNLEGQKASPCPPGIGICHFAVFFQNLTTFIFQCVFKGDYLVVPCQLVVLPLSPTVLVMSVHVSLFGMPSLEHCAVTKKKNCFWKVRYVGDQYRCWGGGRTAHHATQFQVRQTSCTMKVCFRRMDSQHPLSCTITNESSRHNSVFISRLLHSLTTI